MNARLTRRQREVLLLVANGNKRERIARWLGIEKSSVDTRLRWIYRELGVSSQPQAVAVALKLGELRLEDIREPVASYPTVNSLTASTPLPGPSPQPDPKGRQNTKETAR